MKLEPYEIRDPGALVRELSERATLEHDQAYLLLVANPSRAQRVVRIEHLRTPALVDDCDWQEARDEMREVIDAWPVPDVFPPTHAAVLVLVRRGWCLIGPNEAVWATAWRYVNHLKRLYSGDLMIVTEHGWRDLMTDFADLTPALEDVG